MLADLKAWWLQPFSADMNAMHWFYFVGLLLLIGVAWGTLLRFAKGATG